MVKRVRARVEPIPLFEVVGGKMDIWRKAKDIVEELFDRECAIRGFQGGKTEWGETRSDFDEQRFIKCHLMESPRALAKNGYIFETEGLEAIVIYSADETILAGSQLEFSQGERERIRMFMACGDEVVYKTHKEIRVTAMGNR